jgi:hypothetical protein
MWFALATNVVEGVTLLGAFYLLSPHGIMGLCCAYIISYVVRIAVSLPFLIKYNIIPRELVRDACFMTTVAAFVTLIFAKIASLS